MDLAEQKSPSKELKIIDIEIKECMEKDVQTLTTANVEKLKEIAYREVNENCLSDLEERERAIIKLATLYGKTQGDKGLSELLTVVRAHFSNSNKARTAKLMRVIIQTLLESNSSHDEAISLCLECIEWAINDKKTFLCQVFETKLAHLYCEIKKFKEALSIACRLEKDFKKMDYKDQLVEIQIVMCKIYFILGNYQKCRSLLTSARTTGNLIHLSSSLQAHIDLLSGCVNAKESDYVTAYSYFYESFELFDTISNRMAIKALKYMLFCKIMLNRPEDVPALLTGKLSLRYSGRDLDSMMAVSLACKHKNLNEFKGLLNVYNEELVDDPVVKVHLKSLMDALLENNLLLVIEPYSNVELSHIAKLVDMEIRDVITCIARMILEKKLHATLDQGFGILEVFPFENQDNLYEKCIDSVKHLSNIVDTLKSRRKVLS